MNVLIMGAPGAGKGTISQQIISHYDVTHVSTGDMFREAIKEQTPLGKTAAAFIDKGNLVPDDITIAMVKERLSKPDCERGYLLDGFPRTVAQAIAFDQITEEIQRPVDIVLHLDIELEVVIRRISGRRVCESCGSVFHVHAFPPKQAGICDKCGGALYQRNDDTEESVRTRLKTFTETTQPVLEYYSKKGLLTSIDANRSVEEIMIDVDALLGGHLK